MYRGRCGVDRSGDGDSVCVWCEFRWENENYTEILTALLCVLIIYMPTWQSPDQLKAKCSPRQSVSVFL